MLYDKTNLPEDVKMYLREICGDKALYDAFLDCDIEIYDEDRVKAFEEGAWLEELMGPGEPSYQNIKPFARDGSGALWVVIEDRLIGYIGTEGQCGIVARDIHDFMNIVSVWGGYICDYWKEDALGSKAAFYSTMNDPERSAQYDFLETHKKVFKGFMERHGFTGEIYEMAAFGMTVSPFFEVKAVTDEYVDSDSLISVFDGQETLKNLKRRIEQTC